MAWPFDDEEPAEEEQPVADAFDPAEIGRKAAQSVLDRFKATLPPPPTLLGTAVNVGSQALQGFGAVVGAAKSAVDAAARAGVRAAGLPVSDETTTGRLIKSAVFPEQGPSALSPVGIGQIIGESAMRYAGVPEETLQGSRLPTPEDLVAPEGSIRRAIAGAGVEFGGDIATDPLTWVGVPGVGMSRGGRVASKILRAQGPELGLYAPEVASGLLAATERGPVRKAIEKAAHRGFQAMMAQGAVSGGMEAARQYAEAGEITPGVAEAATHAALAGTMLGAPVVAKALRSRGEAEIGKAATIKPTRPVPLDKLPSALIPEAKPIASQFAKMIANEPNVTDTSALDAMLPERLRPHREVIHEQAVQEAMAIQEGHAWVKGLRERYGDEGEPGVEVIPRDETGENFLIVQRDKAGRIVGGAQVDGGVRTFMAGGRGLDSPESFRPVLEKMDELGVQGAAPEMLSVMGAGARRTGVERPEPIEPAYATSYSPDNPFGEKATRARAEYERLIQPTAHEQGMAEAFPLGGGFGRPGAERRMDRSVDRAVSAQKALKDSERLEAQAKAYESGQISPQGRYINPETKGARERSAGSKLLREERIALAREARGNKEPWEVTRQVYADASGQMAGSARGLVEYDHEQSVTQALAEGKSVPSEVLADYPKIQRSEPEYATEPAPERRTAGPGFYSRLREVVDDPKTQGTQSGEAWLRFLQDPKRQVKADELKWTGLDEFLKQKPRVTRQEVQDFLDQNEVKVEEVTKSDRGKYAGKSPDELLAEAEREERIAQQWQRNGDESQAQRHFVAAEELTRAAEGLNVETGSTAGQPKFSQWQEPGGENYRELLLTLPRKVNAAAEQAGKKATEITRRLNDGAFADEADAAQMRTYRDDLLRSEREGEAPSFRSGHFDEPNVLAHVRMNDRVGADGGKVLFIEELQSDWAQKGRREGFRAEPAKGEIYEENGRWYIRSIQDKTVWFDSRAEAESHYRSSRSIPFAPFVTDTSKWTDLATKRILKYAADHGYDRVAWTTGEQQAARYDLSKQLDRVKISGSGPGQIEVVGYKGGEQVLRHFTEPKDLSEVVGKDLADKYLSDTANDKPGLSTEPARERIYSGLDLKVGGEGMKAFYDQMVPQSFARVGKKWGVKAGETQIEGTGDKRALDTILRQDFNSSWGEATPELRAQATAIKDGRGVPTTIHSLDIPDSMRAQVKSEGFPLFSAEKGAQTEPAPDMRQLLLDLYPKNTHIKEDAGAWTVTLPDKRTVTWKTGVDAIEIDLGAFEKAYGRKPAAGERAVGATYRLPNQAIVDIVQGAPERVALHEHWHVVRHLSGLDAKQLLRLEQVYGSEEKQADAFAKWMASERRRPNGIFERILAAVTRLYQHITKAPESVFRQAQESLGQRPRTQEGPAYATEAQPVGFEPFPQVKEGEPLGKPKAAGLPPRVETNVEALEQGLAEQKALGIESPDLILARDTRRTWKSLDPEVRKRIQAWDDDAVLKQVEQGRMLGDTDVLALDAVSRGRYEGKEAARQAYVESKGTPSEDAAWSRYVTEHAKWLPLAVARIQDGTSTGRALAARGRIMEAAQTRDMKFLRRVLREIPGVSARDAENLTRMFESGDPKLATALQAAMTGRMSRFWTAFRANLLGIPSEIGNMVGNAITQGVVQLDKSVALGIDTVIGTRTGKRFKHASSLQAGRAAAMSATPAALRDFLKDRFGYLETTAEGKKQLGGMYGRAWRGESKPIDPNRPIEYQVSGFKSKAGRLLWDTPLEAMGSGDQLYRTPILAQEIAERASELAIKRIGKTEGPAWAAETERIIQEVRSQPEKHPVLLKSATDAALHRVYQDRPGPILQPLLHLRRQIPLMNAVMPFLQTPAKVTSYAVKHSPLGWISPEVVRALKEYKAGKLDQGGLADVLAPRIVGTTIFGGLALAAQAGAFTGGGPTDLNEQKALRATGWQPYSIVIPTDKGKVYLPFNRFEPIAQVAGIAADLAEMKDSKSIEDVMSKAIGTVTANLADRTYMRGLMDFTDALSDPRQYMGTYLAGFSRAVVPRNLANLAKAIDPIMRDVKPTATGLTGLPERIAKTVAGEVPILSRLLPEQRTPTGETRQRPGTSFTRALLPVQVTRQQPGTELEALMAEVDYVPGVRRYVTINGRPVHLDRKDLDVMGKADRAASAELRRIIHTTQFRMLPDRAEEAMVPAQSKEGVMKAIFARHRREAREVLLMSRDFRRRAAEQTRRPLPS